MGNQKHHRVLSTSTCDLEECLRPYAMCNIYILYYEHFATFYVSLYDIYTTTKNNQIAVSIHTGFLTDFQ
jgi:hypothetical protein